MVAPPLLVAKNPSLTGRDWIVPDIHGYFNKLKKELHAAGFSPETGDRLFVLGDLVNRGPDSHLALDWLTQPWFHAIQGNHEALAILYMQGILCENQFKAKGGQWFMDSPLELQMELAYRFAELPIAIELSTPTGRIGLIHANVPDGSWEAFKAAYASNEKERLRCQHFSQWDPSRVNGQDESIISDIDLVLAGHNFVLKPLLRGNVLHLDTGGWLPPKPFRIFDATAMRLL